MKIGHLGKYKDEKLVISILEELITEPTNHSSDSKLHYIVSQQARLYCYTQTLTVIIHEVERSTESAT